MTIQADCPECGHLHRVKDEIAGRKFACKNCGAAVRVPQPVNAGQDIDFDVPKAPPAKKKPDDFDWDQPLGDTAETAEAESVDAMPALPPVTRKKKTTKKVREVVDDDDDDDDGAIYRSSTSSGWMIAGMPVPIVISLGCHAFLWLTTAYFIVEYFRHEQPFRALGQIFWIAWLTWLMYDIANGAMRSRYMSILMSISGLTWVAVSWMVFIPLMNLSPLVKEQPWILTFAYVSVAFHAFLYVTNIIALCMPSAAEHCSEWEGG